MDFKNLIRTTLNFLHLDITKNLAYDRLTNKILTQSISKNANCIDIGCHKGEILELIIKLAPQGTHFGFEPIPELFQNLQQKFASKATILPFALSDKNGTSTFQFVKNAPAYSGINKRKYAVETPDIEEINVELKKLDEVIPNHVKVDLIKIDVEGGEFAVLKGAKQLLIKNKPIVIFECGLGASEYYGTNPNELFQYLNTEIGLKIFTLKAFINKQNALTESSFVNLYQTNKEYYFVAANIL
jgi:FkbM family methyltransferase